MDENIKPEYLIEKYKEYDDAELEIRFSTNNVQNGLIYKKLAQKILNENDIAFNQYIQFLTTRKGKESKFDETHRRVIYYKKGKFNNEEFTRKIQLGRTSYTNRYFSYTLNLAREIELEEFSSNTASLIRIVVRATAIIGKWKYDFNITKEIPVSYKNEISNFKHMYESKMTVDKFLDLIDPNAYKIQLELEYLNEFKSEVSMDSLSVVDDILNIIDPEHIKSTKLQNIIYEIAQHIKPKDASDFKSKAGLKQLFPQVMELTKPDYLDLMADPSKLMVTDKADGVRCLVYIMGSTCWIVSDELIQTSLTEDSELTIVDAELIKGPKLAKQLAEEKKSKKYDLKLYVFDVLVIKGKNITNKTLEERLDYLDAAVEILEPYASDKRFVHLDPKKYGKQIKEIMNQKLPYEIDGMILSERGKPYYQTRHYKVKPKPTIDFLVKRVPSIIAGKKPYLSKKDFDMYFLFNGIDYQMFKQLKKSFINGYDDIFPKSSRRDVYFPIQFSPSDYPKAYIYYHPHSSKEKDLDNKIVEMAYEIPENGSIVDGEWKIIRIRHDRQQDLNYGTYYGNNFRIAELTWQNFSNPMDLEFLMNPTIDSYFKYEKQEMYSSLTSYNSFVKGWLIENQLKFAPWVIDLAAGKGQDLFRYSGSKVENILFVDSDKAALAELINRKYNNKKGGKPLNMNVLTHTADLSRSYKTTAEEFLQFVPGANSADGVVCNFAIHYFAQTDKSLNNFINLIDSILKKGKPFIFTCLNGEAVHKLLKPYKTNKSWDVEEDGVMKYSIRKLYKEKEFMKNGQKIELILPFTGKEYYTEYLVNIEYLLKLFENKKYTVVQNYSFEKLLPKFKDQNPVVYDQLTDDDKTFIGLYSYVSVWR